MSYEILVCPVCLQQMEHDPEYGSDCYHDEYGGSVEAIRLTVEPQNLSLTRDLALFRLQDAKREAAFKLAERRVYEKLSQEEKDRLKAERWAKMSPMEKALHQQLEGQRESLLSQLSRGGFMEVPTHD